MAHTCCESVCCGYIGDLATIAATLNRLEATPGREGIVAIYAPYDTPGHAVMYNEDEWTWEVVSND